MFPYGLSHHDPNGTARCTDAARHAASGTRDRHHQSGIVPDIDLASDLLNKRPD
jgi:hypothetical protein